MITNGSVLLGYIHGGTVRAEFMRSVLGAVTGPGACPLIGGVTDCTAGPLVAMARNMLARQFLDGPFEWLWSVDTDIMFDPGTLPALAGPADAAERPAVSALYWVSSAETSVPCMYRAHAAGDGELTFSPFRDWPAGTLLKVHAVGAGCLLVHRDVLEKIAADAGGADVWFREAAHGSRHIGEDLSFCIRVGGSGFPLWVHTGVQVGHVKPVIMGEVTVP